MEKGQGRKKRAALIVLLVLIIAAGAAVWFLREPLSLLRDTRMSEEQIQTKTEEKDKIEETVRTEYKVPEIKLDSETIKDIQSGNKTVEEVANQIVEEAGASGAGQEAAAAASGAGQEAGSSAGASTPPPEEDENAKKLKVLLTQAYVLRDSFVEQIEGVVDACREEYHQLDESKQTQTEKVRIVYAHLREVGAMEKECDTEFDEIASQIQELDPALAEQVRTQYENEKSLKKAELLDRFT